MSADVLLQTIRYAATHRLCVDLTYDGSHRVVEPYALRLTRKGNLLLSARRRDSTQLRTYRLDRVEDAQLTAEHFHPVYNIEMTAGGPILLQSPR